METYPKRTNDLWLTEAQTENLHLSLRATDVLRHVRTPYQDLLVIRTLEYGNVMVLDGAIQVTERDEFCYHEMMAHVALCAHPDPKRVLIVGGATGGPCGRCCATRGWRRPFWWTSTRRSSGPPGTFSRP